MSDPPVLAPGSIDAVVSDVLYTLIHNIRRMLHYDVVAPKFGLSLGELGRRLDPTNKAFELGLISSFDRMRQVDEGQEIRLGDQEIQRICDEERVEAARWWRWYDGVPQALMKLAEAGVKVGLCSNLNPVGRYIVGALNVAQYAKPGAAVYSCDVHKMKPDPEIYLEVCRRLGVEPSRCLFADDGGSHGPLAGAQVLGMKTAAILNPDGYAFSHPHEPEVVAADYRLARFTDVVKLLGIPA